MFTRTARVCALVVLPLACGGEPPEPAEIHFRVTNLDSAPTCGPSLVASGLALGGERDGQGSVLVVAEAPTAPDTSWWFELEALDDGRLFAALRERRGEVFAFDGHAELDAAPELTRVASPPSLTGAVALTLQDDRAGALRVFAEVGPSGRVPTPRAATCASTPPAPVPTSAPRPRAPGRTDVVVVADPGCGGAASGCSGGAASGCGSDSASGCSGDSASDGASGCSGDSAGDAASGCSGDGAGGCADDAGGCAGDAVSARGARQAATRTAAAFWPIALVGLVNRRWRRARASAPDRGAPRPSP